MENMKDNVCGEKSLDDKPVPKAFAIHSGFLAAKDFSWDAFSILKFKYRTYY